MINNLEDIHLMPDINQAGSETIYNNPKIKRLSAIVIIAAIGTLGSLVESKSSNQFPLIDKQHIDVVDYNLDHPENPNYIELDNKSGLIEFDVDSGQDLYLKKIAKECNLTLINPYKYIKQLKEANTVDEAVISLNEYSDKFGFKFEIIDQLEPVDEECGLYDRALLSESYIQDFVSTNTFKDTALSIMKALGYTPKEYIEASGIKEVRFLRGFGQDDAPIKGYSNFKTVPGAIAHEDKDLVYFAISSFSPYKGPEIFFHELGHLIDGKQMGKYQSSDPQYTSLNPKDFKYFDQSSYQKHQDAVVDEYASFNVIEDKGMIYQNFIYGPRLAFSSNPIIREKTRLLVARLEEQIPNISKYYAALSSISLDRK